MLNINYIPEKKKAVKLELDYFYWGFWAIILFIIVFSWHAILQGKIKKLETEISSKKQLVAKNDTLLKTIDKLQKQRLDLQKKKEIIDQLDFNRQKWVKVLDNICDIIPPQVWLTKFNGQGLSLSISGYGLTILYINDFIKSLKEQEDLIAVVTLKAISAGKVPEISQPIYKYDIAITLKNEVKNENK
ncbi:PilN domain-containing protein [bacterium]|nr:PilN domain-containing protein [bacterium]